MSPLTKLFVVLLVLVSIILTAGVVTFVNKLDPLQTRLSMTQEKLTAAESLLNTRQSTLDEAQTRLATAREDAKTQANALNTQIQTLRANIEDREAQLAKAKVDLATLTSANTSQASALQMSEEAKGKMQEQVTGLRKDADERLRQVADLNGRVSQLTAENAVLEKERRNLAEQLTDAKGRIDKMGGLIRDLGGSEAQIAKAGTKAGAPPINGIIRSLRTIAGQEYATISIGSQDQVIKGMEFKILDKETGAFLGILTVDVVDANEAMGRIVADQGAVAQIKAGAIVKTQI